MSEADDRRVEELKSILKALIKKTWREDFVNSPKGREMRKDLTIHLSGNCSAWREGVLTQEESDSLLQELMREDMVLIKLEKEFIK